MKSNQSNYPGYYRMKSIDTDDIHMVSAIITTHNRLALLKRAVKSVEEQTYPAIELIVVDDASTDGTKEWCESQAFKYIRITKEESRGGNYARNLGAKNSNGEYLSFLDDDDYWLPNKTESQIALLNIHPESVIYCWRTYEIYKNGKLNCRKSEVYQPNLQGDISESCLLSPCVTSTSTLLIPKDIFWSIGGWDEDQCFWQDNDLIVRLAQKVKFWYVDKELVIYTINQKDKKRLSNKYYEWRNAAKRFYAKHALLYSKLSFRKRLHVKQLYLMDASIRASSNGMRIKWFLLAVSGRIIKYMLPKFN